MSEPANRLRQELPQPTQHRKLLRVSRADDEDRLLHQITREAFAMNGDQRTLALSLLKAVRGWKTAA